MQFIKGILLLVLILAIVAGGGYVARRYIHLPPQVATLMETAATVPQAALVTGQSVVSQAIPTVEKSGEVLGAQINIKKSDKSIPERAFEYGRYEYCVQVVKDYQSRQEVESIASPSATH